MKNLIHFFAIFSIFLSAQFVSAQTTEFTYQGKLTVQGTQSATYDFEFRLCDSLAADCTTSLATNQRLGVAVSGGAFTVKLDFGAAAFQDGSNRWLEIAVKRPGEQNFVTLDPRQPLTSAPYSIKSKAAEDSTKLGGVNAGEYLTTATADASFIKNSTAAQTANFNVSGNGIVGGVVGIGTTTPLAGYRVDILGGVRSFGDASHFVAQATGGTNSWARFYMRSTNRSWFIGTSQNFNGDQLYFADETANQTRMVISTAGFVGINNTNPLSGLDIRGTGFQVQQRITDNTSGNSLVLQGGAGGSMKITGYNFGSSTAVPLYISTDGANTILNNGGGNVGIGVTNPTQKLEVAGTTKTGVLQITGGSDLAENFAIADTGKIKAGMVVAIDPNNAGKLVLARGAYNRRVAGIVSGANNLSAGMILPDLKEDSNALPVALSGRVWVYADATRNPIQPGDLLTTSDAAGYAMKATNYKRAQGAIIGKAMTELKSGTGLVLVLVSLQ